ncbi:hypothetical protein Ccrd_002395 [Cynara cardunculus var. scolymus]|uniref:Uncharacterized protein n=1 Tax=Cynara cardunculus var. scolymus TaxID=59895 RepID=A0A103XRH8_CYNCS|nr:hypothetical protein Ccrd_002395 [Cynara cardunculus var. scolymus]
MHRHCRLDSGILGCSLMVLHPPPLSARFVILAYFDDPQYIRKSSGLTKHEIRELNSIINVDDLIDYQGVKVGGLVRVKKRMKLSRRRARNKVFRCIAVGSGVMIRCVSWRIEVCAGGGE